jgi:hypothetical protein
MLAMHNNETSRVLTCLFPCSGHTALVATVPQEALGRMQHSAYLQNRFDALFSATAST